MTLLRLGTKDDVPKIMQVVKTVVHEMNSIEGNFQWDDKYPLESDFLADIEHKTLWVVCSDESDADILGFAAITFEQPPEYSRINWDINSSASVPHRVAVNPKSRGLGIAQMLLKKAEDVATEVGYPYVRLDTNEINLKMRTLVSKLGYEYCGSTTLDECSSDILFACYQKKIAIDNNVRM